MADWRQIQARIRKAKNGRDPSAKLSELYQRTRDAMVAWELGAIEEKAEHADEATKWYTIAAQRFRRSDWKKKAEEALTRLGAPLPPEHAELPREIAAPQAHAIGPSEQEPLAPEPEVSLDVPQEEPDYESQTKFFGSAKVDQREERVSESGEILPPDAPVEQPAQAAAANGGDDSGKRKRRRGRRGGRGRRRGSTGQGLPAQTYAPTAESRGERPPAHSAEPERAAHQRYERHEAPNQQSTAREERSYEPPPQPVHGQPAAPQLPSERMAHGRAGDPGVASRMNHLDSLLRRLLGGALHRVGEADEAPAGPGVFLLSDSDQTTSYYVEACQTLRVGIANLVRGRGGKGRPGGRGFIEIDLKEKLADHLGISESKVADYLKNHCVVRWIQLDDEAAHLAHFAVAVLRTPLNLG